MSKITISDITDAPGSVIPAINAKFQQIEDELNDKVLYRDNPGTEDNTLKNHIDMAEKNILNAKQVSTEAILLDGLPLTRDEFGNVTTGGDMLATVYDPTSIAADAFARANMTGVQAISTVTGLQAAIDAKEDSNSSIVYVSSESDFPDAVLGVRTLAASTTYVYTGFVSTADTLKFSSGSKIMGLNRFSCFHNYTGATDVFTNTASGSCAIEELGIFGGANGTIFNFVGAGAETFVITNSYIVNCKKVGTLDGMRTVVFRSFSVVAASDATNGGLVVKSTTPGNCQAFNMDNSYWADAITNGVHIDFQATNMERIQIPTGNRFNTAAGVTGIKVLASNGNFLSAGVGILSGNIFEGAGTHTSGLAKDDVQWSLINNTGLFNSSKNAQGYNHTLATTTIGTGSGDLGNPILMDQNATFVDSHSDQFTIDSEGRITYIGTDPAEFQVRAVVNGTASAGTSISYNTYIGKNGTAITASKITREYNSGSNGTITTAAIVELVNGNYIEPFIENITNTADWETNVCNLIVAKA